MEIDPDFFLDPVKPEDREACPKCGSQELHHGYGFAAGGLGSYTICMGCDETIRVNPDPDAQLVPRVETK